MLIFYGADWMDQVECVVVGAGVVGLAVARALALTRREVLVLEAAAGIGTAISSRNSEVIHAGIYYPQDSLKARLCVQGRALLCDYCAQRSVGHLRCGKLIVATTLGQVAELQRIQDRASRNGVTDLLLLSAAQVRQLEPALHCEAALLSPSTGIVDSPALMLALQGDLESAGGVLALNSPLALMHKARAAIELEAVDGAQLCARLVVNAAGLGAVGLAQRCVGLDGCHIPKAFYAKGNYFTLTGRAPFSHLVYPVPEARLFMPRCASIGLICAVARCNPATRGFAPSSVARANRRPIFGFRGQPSMVCRDWSICWASSPRG